MQITSLWRSSRRTNHTADTENLSTEQEQAVEKHVNPELPMVEEPAAYLQRQKREKPKTTWIWDRSNQKWVEIIEKPDEEAFQSEDIDVIPENILDAAVETKEDTAEDEHSSPRPSWRQFPSQSSADRAVETRAPGEEKDRSTRVKDDFIGRTAEDYTGISAAGNRQVKKTTDMILSDAESQASQIIAWAEERARLWADKIIAQAEEKAEERAGLIIARAEEKAISTAENIIARAQGKADLLAQSAVEKAEQSAKARTESLLVQAEEKAEAIAQNIIVSAEKKARERAETIMVSMENSCQQMLTQAEKKAQGMLRMAPVEEKKLKQEIRDEVISEEPPAKRMVQAAADNQKTKAPPYEGTAEVVVKPPVDLKILQKALKRLAAVDQIKILDLEGSVGKGVTIKIYSRNIARLPLAMESLPEVSKVSELPAKASRICPGQKLCPGLQKYNSSPVKRFLITLDTRSTYYEI